jgi:hypothetical protein
MLKMGYALMLAAGSGILGYAGYHVVSALIQAKGIPLFFRVLILVAGAGILLTMSGAAEILA